MSDRILVVCDDVFFWARIHEVAGRLGRPAARIGDDASMERAWAEGGAGCLVMDLAARGVSVMDWAARWKARDDAPELIGFVSHVDLETQARARQAGFDRVLPKSRFSQEVETLLGGSPPRARSGAPGRESPTEDASS